MADMTAAVEPLDTALPNPARVYDYWLGGKSNFAADRNAAERSARAVPHLPWLARENRRFMNRAVRFCANAGITQFLDIGSGLPAAENVHQAAGQVTANPRVVYVDQDPAVASQVSALLSSPQTAAICADLMQPDDMLGRQEVRHLIDFSRPVAVLLLNLLHLVPDSADPGRSVARLREAMAPGSYLVISHFQVSRNHFADGQPLTHAARELAAVRMPAVCSRDRHQILRFFGDLTLIEPGLVDVWAWQPDSGSLVTMSDVLAGVRIGWNVVTCVGCVGRKEAPAA